MIRSFIKKQKRCFKTILRDLKRTDKREVNETRANSLHDELLLRKFFLGSLQHFNFQPIYCSIKISQKIAMWNNTVQHDFFCILSR